MNEDVEIRLLEAPDELRRVVSLFDEVWGTRLVNVEMLRAVGHAGGYVAAACRGDEVVGGSFGFLARHEGTPALHSHVTGVLPGSRGYGVGRAIKLHQRDWAADRELGWVTWTFDPLVRGNAWFNLEVLGARAHEYLVDFYGPIDDAINSRDESDRLLVAWATSDPTRRAGTGRAAASHEVVAVSTPDDIVALRRTDPEQAAAWRRRVRRELGDRLAAGAEVIGFTRAGEYLVKT
jgi:predicted GNAT superfamily acetyltransferase